MTGVSFERSSGAVWKSRWTSWAPVPNKPTVSVDVKQHFNFIFRKEKLMNLFHKKLVHNRRCINLKWIKTTEDLLICLRLLCRQKKNQVGGWGWGVGSGGTMNDCRWEQAVKNEENVLIKRRQVSDTRTATHSDVYMSSSTKGNNANWC